jgi:hypothetical protein
VDAALVGASAQYEAAVGGADMLCGSTPGTFVQQMLG